LRSWPEELGRDELIRYFTLSADDRVWLESAARGTGNRLGMAIQLCTLPWLGFVPDDVGHGGRRADPVAVGRDAAPSRQPGRRGLPAPDRPPAQHGRVLHSLRRDLFFAHEGSVRRRRREQQTEQALCLSLVVNAIITWNTAYLELALEHLAARRGRIDRELLAHVSPALMEHVNPYGTYEFPVEAEYARQGFRPLREIADRQA
jgi:hypothetical protein